MPAVAAHYYFGQEVLKLLTGDVKELAEGHKTEFDLGLQGPDILFYYKVWRKNEVVDMGYELHRQNADTLMSRALKNIKKGKSQEARAYLLGFACHFVLDSTFHGRISELAPKDMEHRELEAELDKQVMEKYCGQSHKKSNRHRFLKSETRKMSWMRLIYPELSEDVIRKCDRSFVFLTRILDSKSTAVKWLIGLAEKALHKEGAFSSMMLREERSGKYFQPAREILSEIGGLASRGAEAVENVYICFKDDCTLQGSFRKNFL
jgi:hypothetical protein